MAERKPCLSLKRGELFAFKTIFFIEHWEFFFGLFSSRLQSKTLCFPSGADTGALQFAYQIAKVVLWISQNCSVCK